jgi:hypothetical protein
MEDFEGKKDFLASLREGKVVGRKTSPLVHIATSLVKVKKRLGWGKI